MQRKMPTMINGRPVQLASVAIEKGKELDPAAIWQVIIAPGIHEPGIWYQCLDTNAAGAAGLKKMLAALRMRAFMKAINKRVKIRATLVNGVCFQWLPETEELKDAQERERRKRLDKKAALTRAYEARQRQMGKRRVDKRKHRKAPAQIRFWSNVEAWIHEQAGLHFNGNICAAVNTACMIARGDSSEDIIAARKKHEKGMRKLLTD